MVAVHFSSLSITQAHKTFALHLKKPSSHKATYFTSMSNDRLAGMFTAEPEKEHLIKRVVGKKE